MQSREIADDEVDYNTNYWFVYFYIIAITQEKLLINNVGMWDRYTIFINSDYKIVLINNFLIISTINK